MMLIDGLFAFLAGVILGVFYFAGLWWTVRQLGSSQYIALLFIASMLFRTGAVIVGFYFILGDNWLRLVVGLVGFMLVRVMAIRYLREKQPTEPLTKHPLDEVS